MSTPSNSVSCRSHTLPESFTFADPVSMEVFPRDWPKLAILNRSLSALPKLNYDP
jgi:hypothetical protein